MKTGSSLELRINLVNAKLEQLSKLLADCSFKNGDLIEMLSILQKKIKSDPDDKAIVNAFLGHINPNSFNDAELSAFL